MPKSTVMGRPNQLRKAFQVLNPKGHFIVLPSLTETIITVRDAELQQIDGDRERFRLYKRGYVAQYFEAWKTISEDLLQLDKAYLEIYTPPVDSKRYELIALHCDPSLRNTDVHYKYKSGPHLHFNGAINPIPDAHITLYLDKNDLVYGDIETFNKFLKDYLTLIKLQILDPIKAGDETQFKLLKIKKLD